MSAASYAGILLALLATTAYNVGMILEKRALGQMPTLDLRRVLHVVVSLLTSRAWLGGFALMLTGLACQTIVLTFEPVSVVQPVLASGVTLVLVLSRLMLRERLRAGETWCVAAIAVSVVLLALSATGAEASHHASPGWVAAVMVPSVVVGLLVAAGALRARRHGSPAAGVWAGVGTGLLYGVAALAIKGLSGILVRHQTPGGPGDRRRLVAVPVCAGWLLGGRDAALPGRAAGRPRVDRHTGIRRHRQHVLHHRGHLAVP